MTGSYMTVRGGRVSAYIGPDAVAVVSAFTLASALRLYVESGGRIIPIRGMGITNMLKLATRVTHKPYKRTQAALAAADVQRWADEMKAALPVVVEGRESHG